MSHACNSSRADDPFVDFLAASEAEQLEFIESLNPADLRALHATYLRHAEDDPSLDQTNIWPWILAAMAPDEYCVAAQDAEIRQALEKDALAKMRAETYENQVRPLLHAAPKEQDVFIESLDSTEQRALLKLLDRYAREYGRSERCRALENEIRNRLEGTR